VESRYSIKDLEQLSGIKAHTLRAWEQRHKLIIPKRTSTNIRFYGDDDLRIVLNTSVLLESGLKIGQIAKLSAEEISEKALEASPYTGLYTYELNELKMSTLNFDLPRFEAVMAHCIDKFGVHKTFQNIIGDYIQELGKFWLAGNVSISQEHFMSSLIRQKLFSAIDSLESPAIPNSGTYALFLPTNELHELGLLYLTYVLKERGEHVFYLGQSLPKEYLQDLLNHQPVTHLISAFTTHPDVEQMEDYLTELDDMVEANSVKVHLTGYQFQQFHTEMSWKNIQIHQSLKDLSASV
jgi:DNA-binding transcriptional MerR regulator